MHHDFDVVIVGGRIAGGTLATELGKLGVKVCVLERDDLQAEPTSTHVIYANTVDRLINQIGVDRDQLMSSGAPRLTSLDMVLQNSINCSFPLRGSYCIRRSVVDNALLDTARRAGAEIRLNARVTGLLDDGQRITGVKLDDGTEIRARFVVGADGLASTVAREVKAETWLDIPSDRFCYFSYFHCPEGSVWFWRYAGQMRLHHFRHRQPANADRRFSGEFGIGSLQGRSGRPVHGPAGGLSADRALSRRRSGGSLVHADQDAVVHAA